jgi:S1-C subfamily serine protease
VVAIEVEGSYQDPYEGWQINVPRGGTGFIIDPSGLAVTNNHVVTGAAQLKVYLNGEDRARNAKVLGVSECSDLALIDIDGDGFPYVDWYSGDLKTGLQVYTAGYPVSGASTIDYSLTQGIISKPDIVIDTEWASVDGGIEHTAKVNPGNSGGPLVTAEGQVVGVNYASNELDQNYSIGRDRAQSVIEELRAGKDVDSIGINGIAISGDLEGIPVTGIWVRSVKSGSPADKARIQLGDIITEVESQLLDEEATMKDYCSVIRAHNPGDTLSVSVIRSGTLELWGGQLNGRELEYVSTLEGGTQNTETTTTTQPSQSGDVYYATEFDGTFDEWKYFLELGNDDGFSFEARDSRLRWDISEEYNWGYMYLDTLEVSDVRLDTQAENLGRNTNNVSLICRYTGNGADGEWYEVNITNGGLFYIYRHDPRYVDVQDRYIQIGSGGSNLIKTGKGINSYTLICNGNRITLGINGVEVKTVTDNVLTYGKVGIGLSSFDITPITLEFDYFSATVP